MHTHLTRLILFFADCVALVITLFVSANASEFVMGHDYLDFKTLEGAERLISYSIISSIVLFLFFNRGHYTRRFPWWSQLRYVVIVCFIAFLIDGFMHFAIKYQFSRLWIGLSWLYAAFFILLMRLLSWWFVDGVLKQWRINTYLIGTGDNVVDALYALYSEKFTGYEPKAILTYGKKTVFEKEQFPMQYQKLKIVTEKEACEKIIKKKGFFIIAPEAMADKLVETSITQLEKNLAPYAVVPPAKGFSYYGTAPQYFFGHDIMLIAPKVKIQSPFGKILKRTLDIIASAAGLIILSPLFVVLFCWVKKDGGPAFFGNKRVGYNGKDFICWKFRSMAVDAEARLQAILEQDPQAKKIWQTHRKLQDDPRVTSAGKFLRKTSLDELPQLWNIFVGEMSLVGPRPIIEDEKEFFEDDQYKLYCSVKPGVTGLWQVSGRNNASFKRRVYLDSWYVKNWSIWHDIVILFKTVITVLAKRGAY